MTDVLSDRPAHGGYPGTVPPLPREDIPRGVSAGPAGPRVTWSADRRVDVTVSLPWHTEGSPDNLPEAIRAELDRRAHGYRETSIAGGWEGEREYGATFSIVGDERTCVNASLAIFHAALGQGCEAVQVEHCGPEGYRCEEWRLATR